jgi:predicted anti-sigma-YlaC factor YlaD
MRFVPTKVKVAEVSDCGVSMKTLRQVVALLASVARVAAIAFNGANSSALIDGSVPVVVAVVMLSVLAKRAYRLARFGIDDAAAIAAASTPHWLSSSESRRGTSAAFTDSSLAVARPFIEPLDGPG